MKTKTLYYIYSNDKEIKSELIFKRNFLLGTILCITGVAVGIYSFHCGLLSLVGICLFLLANMLLLAGVYQFWGVAEIECPECRKMFNIAKLQKEGKCKHCKKRFKFSVTHKSKD